MPIAYITHPDCLLHDVGNHHPERPARLHAIHDQLIMSGLEFVLTPHEAPLVEKQHLERVHDRDYVASLFNQAPEQGVLALDADTLMMPKTLNAALRAAGAVVHGVDLVLDGEVKSAFCAVRPPGHHAERNRAMGFCYFNNIAVGAAYALEVKGLERVAIVDFDVHHGNGTEHIFKHDPRVLLCSSFQHPFYPFTGHETDSAQVVNITLPAGSGGKLFREQTEKHWFPALHEFKPQLLMISAGFDGHLEDEMSQLQFLETDYSWISRRLKEIADQYTEGRIVSSLEGGYALGALGRSVAAHINALLGND